MPFHPSGNPTPEEDYQAAIALINRLLREGMSLSEIDLERRFPNLMPELESRARDLELIVKAEKAVEGFEQGGQEVSKSAMRVAALDAALTGYDVLEMIQEGGQGVVFRGFQRSTQRDVAIKVMGGGQFFTERRAKRFAREIRLVSRIQLPNIVPVYDSGVVDGQPYFVMPMIYGVPVHQHAFLNAPKARARIAIMVRIARAVSRAHQLGIIHRDLKPSNIIIDENDEPQILDFGLAKAMGESDSEENISLDGHVVGTLPYLSPEQATGFGTLDVRSDVYSLGVVLFELLTGTFPYGCNGDKEKARENIIRAKPRSLKEAIALSDSVTVPKLAEFDDDLQAIVSMAIAKSKHERYQSADALADDLDRYLSGGVVHARIDHRWYLTRRMVRKYRVQVTAMFVVFALLIWSNLRTREHQLVAQQQRDSAHKFASLAQNTLGHLVTKVDEEIESLAGGRVVRKSLLADVSDRLLEMIELIGADPSLDSLSVTLQEKQGDIVCSDGDTNAAEFLYLQAARRLENILSDQVTRARLYRKAGNAALDGGAHFQSALRIIRVATESEDPDASEELVRVLVDAARHDYLKGEYIGAQSTLDEALSMFEAGIDDELLHAKAMEWDGDISIKLGDLNRARASLEHSLKIRERYLSDRPFDVRIKHEHMLASMKSCTVLAAMREYESAISRAHLSYVTGEYLCSIDASNVGYRHDWFSAGIRLAWALRQSGDSRGAIEAATQTLESIHEYTSNGANDAETMRRLGFVLDERSRSNKAAGIIAAALEDAEASLVIRESLVELQAENLEYNAELARAHDSVGSCLQKSGRNLEAFKPLNFSLEIRKKLWDRQRSVPDRSIELSIAEINLAVWHIRQETHQDDTQARQLLESANQRLRSLGIGGDAIGSHMKVIEDNLRILNGRKSSTTRLAE